MIAPRLEIDLDRIQHNTAQLVGLLAPLGISVTGVAKATLGSPQVAAAMTRGGAAGLADSRVQNLEGLRRADASAQLTLLRSPMPSQVASVVRYADTSLNSERCVIELLSEAAVAQHVSHSVVIMVELGDLREGVAASEVLELARATSALPNIRFAGLGANLACQSGVVPDQAKMDELSALVERVESSLGIELPLVSGGNSANLDWALAGTDVGRVNNLRLGEAILLGCEPLHRRPLEGLHTDAFTLVAEVIESKTKPAQPWGTIAQAAFGEPVERSSRGVVRQALLALGRQDVDPAGLVPPPGTRILGASSDHVVMDMGELGDGDCSVGAEIAFQLDYQALLRACTSPYVAKSYRSRMGQLAGE